MSCVRWRVLLLLLLPLLPLPLPPPPPPPLLLPLPLLPPLDAHSMLIPATSPAPGSPWLPSHPSTSPFPPLSLPFPLLAGDCNVLKYMHSEEAFIAKCVQVAKHSHGVDSFPGDVGEDGEQAAAEAAEEAEEVEDRFFSKARAREAQAEREAQSATDAREAAEAVIAAPLSDIVAWDEWEGEGEEMHEQDRGEEEDEPPPPPPPPQQQQQEREAANPFAAFAFEAGSRFAAKKQRR